jgi:hypothetical protein
MIQKGIIIVLLSWLTIPLIAGHKKAAVNSRQSLPQIKVQGKQFVDENGKIFKPWGFNYNPGDELLEDSWYTDTTWETIKRNFREMKSLDANVIRIHLDFDKFMLSADKPNNKALNRLKELVDYSEKVGLYLDITGLACYRASDMPAWYASLHEKDRWAAQTVFWQSIAKKVGHSNAVMAYDLMNEPAVPKKDTDSWFAGPKLGGFNFVQYITREPAGRRYDTIMRVWMRQLSAGIREYDKKTLITVGLLPLGNVAKYSDCLDYISTHIYPETGKIDKWVKFACDNANRCPKPLIVEEIFPLSANSTDTKLFINRTKSSVAGYISFYTDIQKLHNCKTFICTYSSDWLKTFVGIYSPPAVKFIDY